MLLHTSKRIEIEFSQNGFLNNFPELLLNVLNDNELKRTSASMAITCLRFWCGVLYNNLHVLPTSDKRNFVFGFFRRSVSPARRLIGIVVASRADHLSGFTCSLCLSATMRLAALKTKIFGSKMNRIILTDLCRSRHRCCCGSPTPTENPLTRHQTLEEACLDDVLETFSKVWSSASVCALTFPSPLPSPGTMGEICFYARVSDPTGYPGLHLPYTARRPISLATLVRMDVDASELMEI